MQAPGAPTAISMHSPAATPAAAPISSPPWEAITITPRAAAMRPREIRSPRMVNWAREMRTVPARIIRLMTCREERLPSSRLPVQGEKATR